MRQNANQSILSKSRQESWSRANPGSLAVLGHISDMLNQEANSEWYNPANQRQVTCNWVHITLNNMGIWVAMVPKVIDIDYVADYVNRLIMSDSVSDICWVFFV